jgi:hypothetical protein
MDVKSPMCGYDSDVVFSKVTLRFVTHWVINLNMSATKEREETQRPLYAINILTLLNLRIILYLLNHKDCFQLTLIIIVFRKVQMYSALMSIFPNLLHSKLDGLIHHNILTLTMVFMLGRFVILDGTEMHTCS